MPVTKPIVDSSIPVYIPHLRPIIWFDLFLFMIFILLITVLSFESYNPSLIKY